MQGPSPFGRGNPERPSLPYLFLRFLRHGLLAWGGPVAQIALMQKELVARDGWITEDRFRKTLALYQALPGPEAHELAVYFGVLKRGRLGGFLTGLAFMLPGILLVTVAAALYVAYASTASTAPLILYGVRPAVVALIFIAFLRLLRATVATPEHVLVAAGSILVALLYPATHFVLILAAGGVAAVAASSAWARVRPPAGSFAMAGPLLIASYPALSLSGMAALAWVALKAGLLSFGGAYTAIPFLHQGTVVDHGWVSEAQFLDAVAISGILPGPLIAVGTFLGYQAAGLAGAALATTLIFAPAFAFTLLGHRVLERLIDRPNLHEVLLGVTASVVGLIVVATIPLARAALTDATTVVLAGAATAALATRKVPVPVVIVLSGACGTAAAGFDLA